MAADGARRRLEQLCSEHGLDRAQQARLAALLDLLDSDERAPTAVSSPERAVDVHVADSLAALGLEVVRGAATVTDIGSGAGVPGLVLAVALPRAELWLLESQARRCAFIERAADHLGLENAHAVRARAEQWPEGAARSDLVTARAVAAQPVVLEYAAPLLRLGGTLVDWRGRRLPEDERAADRAAAQLGLRRTEIRAVGPWQGARDHHLHVFAKVAETPPRFPRRAGAARKRPLGA
jgi:16S rRNA (guanine527-N7)-methyltransferase